MQQNNHDGAQVPFTVYQAQAIQELDAEYSMWAENVDKHTEEIQRLRDDFEKMRNGYMTLLTKLERQEGLHRLVSIDDAAFMAQVGMVLEEQHQYQRVWWIDAVQYTIRRL